MASASEISNALAGAMADQITVKLDSGDVGGILNVYDDSGGVPANCEAANTGVLLGTIALPDPAFGGFTDTNPGARVTLLGVPLSDTDCDASGTALYYRGYSCNTAQTDANKVTCFIQGSAGEAADSTDLTIDNKVVVQTGTLTVTGWVVNVPESA